MMCLMNTHVPTILLNMIDMNTVNHEIFVAKIFSDSMGNAKIKHMKIINSNAVRSCLSENYLTRKFIAQNIFDTKYSRFRVVHLTRLILIETTCLAADTPLSVRAHL